MLKSERHEAILEILQNKKCMAPQDLAEQTYASYSSIRRDLEDLENSGLIIRSYGKVELANNNPTLIAYPVRSSKNSELKHIIAKKAAALIHEGDTIFIDPSSSCTYFAKELINIKGITIVTNNIEILYCMTQNNVNVICSGGSQAEPNRYGLTGAVAENTFKSIHADWTVFSTRSLTETGLLYDVYYNEIAVRNMMFENSDKKIFLCDNSKINTISPYYQCGLSDIDYIVGDIPYKKYKKLYPELIVL